jgi:hypothetical protein
VIVAGELLELSSPITQSTQKEKYSNASGWQSPFPAVLDSEAEVSGGNSAEVQVSLLKK